jgi:membrane protease subunit HflK
MLTNVNLQDAQPPEEVQDAFADAIKAREDEQRLKNEAEAYANEVLPKARGQAARRLEEAAAYRDQVIAGAEGDASRFEQVLGEYRKAPDVTRERLYLETMESVLGNISTVVVDVENSNNLFYFPIEKLLEQRSRAGRSGDGEKSPPGEQPSSSVPTASVDAARFRDTTRDREIRQ